MTRASFSLLAAAFFLVLAGHHAWSESRNDCLVRLTSDCMRGDLSRAASCRRQAEASPACGGSANEPRPSVMPPTPPVTTSPSQPQTPKTTTPRPPAAPPPRLTNTQLYDAYGRLCDEFMGAANISGNILSCGTVRVEPARSQRMIQDLVLEACRNAARACDGNQRRTMIDISRRLQCDHVGSSCR